MEERIQLIKPEPDGWFDIYLNPTLSPISDRYEVERVTILFKDTWWIRPEANGLLFRMKNPDCMEFYSFTGIRYYRHHMNSDEYHQKLKAFQKQCDHVWVTKEDDLGLHKFEVCSECDVFMDNLAEVMDSDTGSSD